MQKSRFLLTLNLIFGEKIASFGPEALSLSIIAYLNVNAEPISSSHLWNLKGIYKWSQCKLMITKKL